MQGGKPYLRIRGMIASRRVNMVRHPRGSYIVIPITGSGVATPGSKKVGTKCRNPSYERFLGGYSSPVMRPAEHLMALRA